MTTNIPQPPLVVPYTPTFEEDMTGLMSWFHLHAPKFGLAAEEINAALNKSLLGVTSDSTTSLPITVTAKTLMVAAGLGYAEGMPLKLASKANVSNYIKGVVTAYNKITGQLEVLAKSIGGSGTFADWTITFDLPDSSAPKIPELVRSANTMLLNADSGSLVLASGTWAQTFDTANFSSGWYAYVKVASGEITIPASDGRTNWVMYANELRLFRWNGTALTSEIIHPFYATFTTSGSFIKPPGYSLFSGLLWGAGASGSASRYAAQSTVIRGAGAGACHPFNVAASALSNSTSVVIGSGGASVSATSLNFSYGNDGGNSTFSSFTGYGGSAYFSAGSGVMSKALGERNSGGAPNPGFLLANESDSNVRTTDSYFGGGYGGVSNTSSNTIAQIAARAGHSYYGAAGATGNYGDNTYHTTSGAAGNSVYGGTAGQGVGCNNSGPSFFALNKGTSTFGGTGGNADFGAGARVGQDGGARGGGGGAAWSTNNTSAVSGAGGRGELQIWGVA